MSLCKECMFQRMLVMVLVSQSVTLLAQKDKIELGVYYIYQGQIVYSTPEGESINVNEHLINISLA